MKKAIALLSVLLLAIQLITPTVVFSSQDASAGDMLSASTKLLPKKPDPGIRTASDPGLARLAPDLKSIAKNPQGKTQLVSVLLTKEISLSKYMKRVAYSQPIGGVLWATGEILDTNLLKVANLDGVQTIFSTQSFKPVDVPGEEELKGGRKPVNAEQLKSLLQKGGKKLLIQTLRNQASASEPTLKALKASMDKPIKKGIEPTSIKVRDIHGATTAQNNSYTGNGVTVAVVDTGVDFAHPDLQNTQARVAGGPYDNWPFAYNTLSGAWYVLDPTHTIGPDTYWDFVTHTWYVHTLPVASPNCNGTVCTANLKIDYGTDAGWWWSPVVLSFTWPDTSKSGAYFYSVHPDFYHLDAGSDLGLGYAWSDLAPAAIIVSDETTAGVYDTVYVDVDFDQDLTNEKPMRKGNELAGADVLDASGSPGTDGIWDLSAGMLTWISDGTNPPPGVGVLYRGVNVPSAGRLLSFIGDEDGHGTNCAGDIAAQGVITDSQGIGSINPLFAGAAGVGGVGGPVLAGMAPDAKVAAFQKGFNFPFDSWVLAALGFDGIPESGDEAQIVSNSWGASATIEDGWDATSRFAHRLVRNYAPRTSFLVATGNGGHGFGTVTEPDGGPIIDVGASTSYGSLVYFEVVNPDQFTYGAVQPWSNRGPTALGDLSPDIVAVGAWGTGANPLNIYSASPYWANGQAAYDIFGGTSMATPIAAGNLALLYQAYKNQTGNWPTWQVAKDIFLSSATDLGYDTLTQGSGNVNADRATKVASGNGYWVSPSQWVAGNYRGVEYAAFPSILHAGQSALKTFTVHNTSSTGQNLTLSDSILEEVKVVTYTVNVPSGSPPPFTSPTWLTDLTSDITNEDPDLVRAQVIFPYSVFDSDADYIVNNRWRVLIYDWKDLNSNGSLWSDTNSNGLVDSGEIDSGEYNRFTYGYPTGTYLEASVGRDALSRKHNGVFLGLQRRSGTAAVTLQVRVTYYKKTNWTWLSTPTTLNVPASGTAAFNATISVPNGTRPGVYNGAIEVGSSVIPVVVHVAANSSTFDFGATSLSEAIGSTPFDNGHLLGGFDWTWRYEAGDWKLFYFDIPNGTSAPGKAMVVDTQWVNPATSTSPDLTDVDTWIFAATPDFYSTSDPAFFGPSAVELVNGSNDTYQGNGTFHFDTATGGPREVVSGELRDGLGFLAFHNVLYAGLQFGEPLVGSAYQVESLPTPVVLTATQIVSSLPPQFGGSWGQSFRSSKQIPEGLGVLAFGLSRPLSWTDENLLITPSLCDWKQDFTVNHGGLIEASSSSSNINDIDLYLYLGSTLIAASITATANENISIKLPSDGSYSLCVDNWSGTSGTFNLDLRVVQGNNLSVSGLPLGGINASTPVNFTINYTTPDVSEGAWEGLLFIGPASAPTAIEIPVTIIAQTPDVLLSAVKRASTATALSEDTFTYTIEVTNSGTSQEVITVEDSLPALVEYVIGSASPSTGTVHYNIIDRKLIWDAVVAAGQTVTLTFQVKAGSGFGWAENEAVVLGQSSAQSLTTEKASTFISPYALYLPVILQSAP